MAELGCNVPPVFLMPEALRKYLLCARLPLSGSVTPQLLLLVLLCPACNSAQSPGCSSQDARHEGPAPGHGKWGGGSSQPAEPQELLPHCHAPQEKSWKDNLWHIVREAKGRTKGAHGGQQGGTYRAGIERWGSCRSDVRDLGVQGCGYQLNCVLIAVGRWRAWQSNRHTNVRTQRRCRKAGNRGTCLRSRSIGWASEIGRAWS